MAAVYIGLIILLTSCGITGKSTYTPTKKYGAEQLKEDFSTMEKILRHNHPSLYWYASADSVNSYFAATYNSLTDSLNEVQFRNRIAQAVSKIHCGHTVVRSSKEATNYYSKKRLPLFPLSLKVWKDTAVVVGNLLAGDSTFTRGAIINSINGRSTRQITDSLLQFINTDGYADVFKYQVISFNFPVHYRNAYGVDSSYSINYTDTNGITKQKTIKNFFPIIDTSKKITSPELIIPEKKILKQLRLENMRSLKIDSTTSTAYLSVNTFSEGKLIRFFKKSFKAIKRQGVKNLVVDLRLNSGGDVLTSTNFTEYLIDKPFHLADTVAGTTRKFIYKKNVKPWFIYWLSMTVSGRKRDDGRIHFRYFEKHKFKPNTKHHFNGNIYLLTGGYTFSAASMVTSKLKGQKNVTIVGEETGGGAYGNTAMFLSTITLPHSGIRVTLPLYRMVINKNFEKNGRGVFPDVEVGPVSTYIKNGIDAKLEKVEELISDRQNMSNNKIN